MKKRTVSIQLLRVSACFLVFFVHFGQRVGLSGILRAFTDFGAYGVQLFLLISGFLAGKTFLSNSDVDILTYYKKRIIAILPLYYLVIAYYFISENLLNHFFPVIPADELNIGWLRYIFLLNGFLNSETYFWSNLGITWTIPIFMFFYLIAPWVLRKINTVFSSAVLWGFVFISTSLFNKYYTCVIFEQLHLLFLGVVIYACVKDKCSSLAIVVFAMSAICMTILGSIKYTYVSLFSCVLLATTATDIIHLPEWMQRALNVLDKYSYTIYLMHGVVFCSVLDRLNIIGVSKIIIAIIAIVGSFIATFVVGKFIEHPIQKFLTKRFIKP